MIEIELETPPGFNEACISFAALQKYSCLLISNNISSACGYNTYELLFAYSNSDKKAITHQKDNFLSLKEHLIIKEKSKWLFGHFGYDLKNEIEELFSDNPDPITFSDMFFFEAETVICIPFGSNRVRIQSDNPELEFQKIVTTKSDPFKATTPIQIKQLVEKDEYIENVQQIKNHIYEGDFYELNYCIPFSANGNIIPPEIFQKLNTISPMPFAAFYKIEQHFLICASPERFLKKIGEKIVAQPIKGTRPRNEDPELDVINKNQLGEDEKERAENVMIVDLMRNDLSKTSMVGSVQVEELFGIYSFKRAHQMISTITSTVDKRFDAVDVIRNAFPMGSMTGAPKIEVMKAIDKVEKIKRGLFSGSLGYFSSDGDFDFNVVIRSILYNANSGEILFQVGSAITFDSDPELEYEECLLKASGMLKVLQADN